MKIDHADIVVTHECNLKCPYCVDTFLNSYKGAVKDEDIIKFLTLIKNYSMKAAEVLLIGGEPTFVGSKRLIEIANIIHSFNYKALISTNGIDKKCIEEIYPYFDWIQITAHNEKEINYWLRYKEKTNLKWMGDDAFNINTLKWFEEISKPFGRRSIVMYFTPDFKELCQDKEVWNFLDSLEWETLSTYQYAYHNGVRYKKCIHGVTNIADEPLIPKLYPNGNYNKSWLNEDYDPYLGELK